MKSFFYYSLFFTLCFFSNKETKGQNLFDINTIRDIEINFYVSNWDHLLDSLAILNTGTGSGTGRILADVIIDGTTFDSCGVRFKGNSSMDTASNKNPFNIDLNYTISSQNYMGKDKIKLANNYTDPCMVREALMYEISNQYMDCPGASFVRLTVNGDYKGIYTNTESIDNEFLNTYYGSSNNPFFKCDPNSFELFGDNSNLAHHPDTITYDTLYDMKSSYGLTELQTLCFNLENNPNTVDQLLDIDRALWFLALSNVFVHNDGYTAFAHNYYIYKMDNGRWSIILWDVNMSFGGLLWNGTNLIPLGLAALETQDPFLHQSAINFRPLIAQLLSIPRYKKMYTAHYKTIFEENVTNGDYLTRAEFMSNLIDTDVQNENYNSYTYTEFTDNIYNDVGFFIDLRPGLQNLMNGRIPYINSLPDFQFTQPIISNITYLPVTPSAFGTVDFTCNISNGNYTYLGYRYSKWDTFDKVEMFDDGVHNDGAAGDGIYGAQITLQASDVEYYFYSENNDIGVFSPVRAEYEFYNLAVGGDLVINELAANNTSTQADQDGEFDDWIELYNNTSLPITLDGYYLSDEVNYPAKWSFPIGTTINANDYIIIWADKDTLQAGLHANFKLSGSGESLHLSNSSATLLDETTFNAQTADITWGRYPNGTGLFTLMNPTFSAQNSNNPIGVDEIISKRNEFNIYPNPTSENVTISFNSNKKSLIHIYNVIGKLIHSVQTNEKYITISVSNWSKGLYIIKSQDDTKKLIVR
jgi:hypothetical protein